MTPSVRRSSAWPGEGGTEVFSGRILGGGGTFPQETEKENGGRTAG